MTRKPANRIWLDVTFVIASLFLFAIGSLPWFGIFQFQPFAIWIAIANFICGFVLVIELTSQGMRRLWLLIGIVPGMYVPVMLLIMFIGCSLRLTADCL